MIAGVVLARSYGRESLDSFKLDPECSCAYGFLLHMHERGTSLVQSTIRHLLDTQCKFVDSHQPPGTTFAALQRLHKRLLGG